MIIMLLFVVALISTDLLVQDLILLQPDDLICCSQACCASGKIFEDVLKEEDVSVLTKVKAHIDFFFVLFKSAGLISAWKIPWMHFALVCGVFKASDLFLSAILLQMVDLNLPW